MRPVCAKELGIDKRWTWSLRRWCTTHLCWIGGDQQRRILDDVQSYEEFQRSLLHERVRADRNEHEFSLLLLEGKTVDEPSAAHNLIRALTRRVREIDEIGWFDERRLGLLLPYTPSTGAQKLADDIRNMTAPSPLIFTIYTYPSQWLPAEITAADSSGQGKPSSVFEQRPVRLFAERIPIWKRAMDIAGSIIGLVCLSPLLLLLAVVIKAVSPGAAILKQKRLGHHGGAFSIWKFRTMKADADTVPHQTHLESLMASDKPMTKLDSTRDPRIIPFGNLIRRCCLDELPQLINVLRGEMSLVGPRPCMPYEAQAYQLWQTRRFDAMPGMTGLWQVSGKNRTTFKEMIRLDIAYARQRSFWLDLRILLMTAPTIVREFVSARSNRKTYESQ